jgi:hypothetical protein
MAVTVTKIESFVFGAHEVCIADVAFDNSYPLGGEALTAANFGFEREITHVFAGVARDPDTSDNAYVLDWDDTNSKLVAFRSYSADDGTSADYSPLVEAATTGDLSAYTARVVAIGK